MKKCPNCGGKITADELKTSGQCGACAADERAMRNEARLDYEEEARLDELE